MTKVPAMLTWILIIALLGAAFYLYFFMEGYSTLALACVAAAVVVAVIGFAVAIISKIVGILVVVVIALVVVAEVPIVLSAGGTADYSEQYAIVLGAKVNSTQPSRSLLYRLQGALDYLERNPSCTVIVSGAQNEDEDISEAECMRNWLVRNGIADERIIMEDRAFSTKENLANSFDIIRSRGDEPTGNVAVISSAYHLYRSTLLADEMGVKVSTVSCECGQPLLTVNYYLREAFAVWACWLHASGL